MITIQNLCKKFEDKVLFDNFNCSIPDSGFVVFCGESGCGKTTLLNMIGCLERPDSGTIIIDGIDIWRIKKKRELFSDKLGFLFQNFALLEGKQLHKIFKSYKRRLVPKQVWRRHWKQSDSQRRQTQKSTNFQVESSNGWRWQDLC